VQKNTLDKCGEITENKFFVLEEKVIFDELSVNHSKY
jgi:hypothetical protein